MSSEAARALQTRLVRNAGIKRADVARAKKLIRSWSQMARDREFCVEVDVLPADSDRWCERGRRHEKELEEGKEITVQDRLYLDWLHVIQQAAQPVGDGSPANGRPRLPLILKAGASAENYPFRLTDEVIQTLCDDIRAGVPYSVSLEAQGFSKGVVTLWLASADRADARVEVGLPPEPHDEQFLKLRMELGKARRDVIAGRMASLKEIGDGDRRGDPGAHTWTLERLFPKEFRSMAPIEDEQSAGRRRGGGVTLVLNQAAPQPGPPILIDGEVVDGRERTLLLPDSDFSEGEE